MPMGEFSGDEAPFDQRSEWFLVLVFAGYQVLTQSKDSRVRFAGRFWTPVFDCFCNIVRISFMLNLDWVV